MKVLDKEGSAFRHSSLKEIHENEISINSLRSNFNKVIIEQLQVSLVLCVGTVLHQLKLLINTRVLFRNKSLARDRALLLVLRLNLRHLRLHPPM